MTVLGHILHGWAYWQWLKIRYMISYKKGVIVLVNDNHNLDKQVVLHLSDFIKRKHIRSVIVFCKNDCLEEWDNLFKKKLMVKYRVMPDNSMNLLYSYYSYMKFFDNIVFTYTENPADNLLGKYLRETDVNEEDAACLALYHLRTIPDLRS